MAILDIFSKKKKPEPFVEDQKAELPPSKEPQAQKTVVRGARGRFVSKAKTKPGAKEEVVPKKEIKISDVTMAEPVTVTFYGKEIRKIYSNKKWYFAVDDLVALAASPNYDHPVKMKADFNKTKKKVETTIENVIYADVKGCLLLITKVNGVFPGPLTRWLSESAAMPYVPTQAVNIK